MRPKPYKAKTFSGAERRVRELLKQRDHLAGLLERYAQDRRTLARLASKTPQFDNPLHVMAAEKLRDEILGVRPAAAGVKA